VNYGPRSNSFYIAITILHLLALFTFLHTITIYHSICSILCLQQTGEIDNLIVNWGKVLGCVVCRFHVVVGEKLHADKYLSGSIVQSVAKLAGINLRKCDSFSTGSINLGFTTEENLLRCSSYLPLGVPNWVPTTHHHSPLQQGAGKSFWTLPISHQRWWWLAVCFLEKTSGS
jgi:hypothetical protein